MKLKCEKERMQDLYHNRETHELAVLGIMTHKDLSDSWFINICKMYDEKDITTGIERIEFDFNDTVVSVKNVLRERGFYPMNRNIILVPKRVAGNFEQDHMFWEYVCRVYGMEAFSILEYNTEKVYQSMDISDMKIPFWEHHWIWYLNYVEPSLNHHLTKAHFEEIVETDDEDMSDRNIRVGRIARFQGQRYLMHDDGWIEEI